MIATSFGTATPIWILLYSSKDLGALLFRSLLFWTSGRVVGLNEKTSWGRAVPSSGKALLASQFMPVWLSTHKVKWPAIEHWASSMFNLNNLMSSLIYKNSWGCVPFTKIFEVVFQVKIFEVFLQVKVFEIVFQSKLFEVVFQVKIFEIVFLVFIF